MQGRDIENKRRNWRKGTHRLFLACAAGFAIFLIYLSFSPQYQYELVFMIAALAVVVPVTLGWSIPWVVRGFVNSD